MNIYDYTLPKTGETFTTLLEHKNIKINRITSSKTVEPIEYIQEEDEWLVLLQGKATLLMQGTEVVLTGGETLFIPGKTPHSVIQTDDNTLWLAVHIL